MIDLEQGSKCAYEKCALYFTEYLESFFFFSDNPRKEEKLKVRFYDLYRTVRSKTIEQLWNHANLKLSCFSQYKQKKDQSS